MDAVGIGPCSVRLSRRRDVACNIYSCVGFYTTQKDKRLALFSCLAGLKFIVCFRHSGRKGLARLYQRFELAGHMQLEHCCVTLTCPDLQRRHQKVP
jgi:hypothetical protein